MAIELKRHRFSVAEYYRMSEIGVLPEDVSNELIGGDVIDVPAPSPLHAYCTTRLTQLFFERADRRVASLRHRGPFHVDDFNEPNADLLFTCCPDEEAQPSPVEIIALIEVADASLPLDRDVKIPLYARAGVPEVWLVDLVSRSISVFVEPDANGFHSEAVLSGGQILSPRRLPGFRIAVDEVVH